MVKSLKLNVLADHWHNCTRCKLSEMRSGPNIVFGFGNPKAKYLLVYDAPTMVDAQAGQPMAGREGELLLDLLKAAEFELKDIYCTPMVGCWPAVLLPATSEKPAHYIDREPDKEEIVGCLPRVNEIIYRVDPLVIFTMGALPWRVLTKPGKQYSSLDKALGELFTALIPGRCVPDVPYEVIPTLSMKQILASPSYAAHGPLATTAKHLMKGRAYATWLEQTRQRDAKSAGYEAQADPHHPRP